MSVILSHPTGNSNVRQALKALNDADLLQQFYTTISWDEESPISKMLPRRLVSQLSRRSYEESIRKKSNSHSAREWGRMAASNLKLSWFTRHESGPMSIDAVCQSLDKHVARKLKKGVQCSAVYCYEDSASATFSAAKSKGISRIYEHPVGYWREVKRIFEEERERQPEFAPIIAGINDSDEKRERKDQEISDADLIIVPSQYSANSLKQFPGALETIQVVNYGSPSTVQPEISRTDAKAVRVLFVGSLQQRKGLSYFVEACKLATCSIEVTVIGSRVADCAPVDSWLKTCTWHPTLPHGQVLETMRNCDVLVLPSLSEGFGLVVLEAMSQGLTVVVSDHTGASDVVDHGVNGYVVPIRDPQAIAQAFERLASDRTLLDGMKFAALETARLKTWASYRSNLLSAVLPLAGRNH